MPKIRNEHSKSGSSSTPQRDNKFVVVTDGKKRVLLTRGMLTTTYDDALDIMASHFAPLSRDKIVVQTDKLEACEGEFVDIPRESWKDVLPHLLSVKLVEGDVIIPRAGLPTPSPSQPESPKLSITIEDAARRQRVDLEIKSAQTHISSLVAAYCRHIKSDNASTALYHGSNLLPPEKTIASLSLEHGVILTAKSTTSPITPAKPKFSIFILYDEETYGFMVSPTTRINAVITSFLTNFYKGDQCSPPRFIIEGAAFSMSDVSTVRDYGLQQGDIIKAAEPQIGGKPVIYLFAPTSINASVRLSLVKEWSFSAIYPIVPVKTYPPIGQTLEWHVTTHPNGTLTEHTTGLTTSYLYWEAQTHSGRHPPSPPASPSPLPTFNPVYSTLTDADSVVLPTSELTPYLDAALNALTLHVEARTSFITYWLPAILKHEYVALRFLPQVAYEKAAPMEVSPTPDIITRVFMLWKGIQADELRAGRWADAVKRASVDVERWKGIVGIQEVPSMFDETKFRVLEWGGMEVKI